MIKLQKLLSILLLGCSIFIASGSNADEIKGRVVRVLDGDTVEILTPEKKSLRIRMSDIDAPEKNEPFGMKSKQMLSDLIFGKDVSVTRLKIEKYGRTIGRIHLGNTNINLEMAKKGGAWAYRQYLTDNAVAEAEDEARKKKLGLWSLQADQIIAPWDWRKGIKVPSMPTSQKISVIPQNNQSTTSACSRKRTCGQMTSCEEAKFYLNTCGINKLDRNNDGVPCESICN